MAKTFSFPLVAIAPLKIRALFEPALPNATCKATAGAGSAASAGLSLAASCVRSREHAECAVSPRGHGQIGALNS